MDKKKEDLRVERTHKLLQQSLLELIEKQSFETITVKQICDLAMVHRTTFYTHFDDKFQLLSHTLQQIAEQEFKLAQHTPTEIFQELLAVTTKHKNLFSQLLSEEKDSLRNIIRRDMGNGIKEYVTAHSTHMSAIDIEITVEAYVGAVLGVLHWWIDNKMPIDQAELHTKLKLLMDRDFLKLQNVKD